MHHEICGEIQNIQKSQRLGISIFRNRLVAQLHTDSGQTAFHNEESALEPRPHNTLEVEMTEIFTYLVRARRK